MKAQLRDNTDQAIAAGVWGVPIFVVDDLCFWGYDESEMLLEQTIADSGHMIHLDQPAAFAHAIEEFMRDSV